MKKWTRFVKVEPKLLDFYTRSIGYLTQIESLNQFKDFVLSVVVVSSSTSMQRNSICYQKYVSLLEIFKTFEQNVNDFSMNNSKIENETLTRK